MTELTRNEIVRRFLAGSSIRQIACELQLARNTVSRVLARRDGAIALCWVIWPGEARGISGTLEVAA